MFSWPLVFLAVVAILSLGAAVVLSKRLPARKRSLEPRPGRDGDRGRESRND